MDELAGREQCCLMELYNESNEQMEIGRRREVLKS